MNAKCLIIFCAVLTMLFVVNGESNSWSCLYINGKDCVRKHDSDGNQAAAAAAAGTNGEKGAVGAGAGTQDNFNVDFQQIGYGGTDGNEDGNADYLPGTGVNYGNGGMAIGAGYPYNPNFPRFDDPMRFVQEFFRRRP